MQGHWRDLNGLFMRLEVYFKGVVHSELEFHPFVTQWKSSVATDFNIKKTTIKKT